MSHALEPPTARVKSWNVSVSDAQKSAAPDTSEFDQFDGDVFCSEQSEPAVDRPDDKSKPSGDEDRTRDPDKDQRRRQAVAGSSEDKAEPASRGELAGGLKDGERHRTRRKETRSWADETDDRSDGLKTSYSTFESSEIDGSQGLRKDDGRGVAQYSRQDRRKTILLTASYLLNYRITVRDAHGSPDIRKNLD